MVPRQLRAVCDTAIWKKTAKGISARMAYQSTDSQASVYWTPQFRA